MYVPEKLKLNKYREVHLPSNRRYVERFGFGQDNAAMYSGEEVAVDFNQSKIDVLSRTHHSIEKEIADSEDNADLS